MDGGGGERRQRSQVTTTEGIPIGTLLTVPSVTKSGPVPDVPIVAAPTKPWWQSVTIWVTAVGLPVLDVVAQPLLDHFNANGQTRHVLVIALCVYLAIRKKNSNVVLK